MQRGATGGPVWRTPGWGIVFGSLLICLDIWFEPILPQWQGGLFDPGPLAYVLSAMFLLFPNQAFFSIPFITSDPMMIDLAAAGVLGLSVVTAYGLHRVCRRFGWLKVSVCYVILCAVCSAPIFFY